MFYWIRPIASLFFARAYDTMQKDRPELIHLIYQSIMWSNSSQSLFPSLPSNVSVGNFPDSPLSELEIGLVEGAAATKLLKKPIFFFKFFLNPSILEQAVTSTFWQDFFHFFWLHTSALWLLLDWNHFP